MHSSAPPPPVRLSTAPKGIKRPWYLIAALVCAWIFGASAMTEGCNTIGFFKADRTELTSTVQDLARDADREAVAQITEKYFGVMDAAKDRLFPLGVASLLLGATMWGLAAGAMAGRAGARTAIVQVIFVHGLLVVANFFLTPDVRRAAAEADTSLAALQPEPRTPALRQARRILADNRAKIPSVAMAMHLVGYGLVLVALTRRRTREFYDAAAEARSEG